MDFFTDLIKDRTKKFDIVQKSYGKEFAELRKRRDVERREIMLNYNGELKKFKSDNPELVVWKVERISNNEIVLIYTSEERSLKVYDQNFFVEQCKLRNISEFDLHKIDHFEMETAFNVYDDY